MINGSRSILSGIAIGTATIAAAGLLATPASAGTLSVTGVSCSSGRVHNQFICTAAISGGTSPYSYLWQVTSGPASIPSPTAPSAHGACTAGYQIGIEVTVTDATGQQAVDLDTFPCS